MSDTRVVAEVEKVFGGPMPDGLIPDKGADTDLRALASVGPDIAKAGLDLAVVWANDFVKRANATYPKG